MLLSTILLQAAAGLSLGRAGAPLAAALAPLAPAFGTGQIEQTALEASDPQPEHADHYRMTAIIISALIEGACLFAILVCLISK